MKKLMLIAVSVVTAACAPGFRGIYPGMNAHEVADAMGGRGPAQVTSFDQGYAGWYYNEDQCVLMKDNIVVGKEVSKNQGGISVAGIGGFSMKERAQCLPPGVTADPNQSINVGVGGIGGQIRVK